MLTENTKKIIAEEAVKAIMEEKSCAEERLGDLEYLKDVFKQLCAAFDEISTKIESRIQPSEPVEPVVNPSHLQSAPRQGSSVHTVVKGDTFWDLFGRST